jgi:cytochrome c
MARIALTVAALLYLAVPGAVAQSQGPQDLKTLSEDHQVTGVTFCRGVYTIRLRTGASFQFPEINLRFKTDSSDKGPNPGSPAILPAGMRGDRASVIFATPAEISAFVKDQC